MVEDPPVDEGSVHNCDIASNTWMGALFAVQESHCMSSDDNESHSDTSTKDTDDVYTALFGDGSVHNCDIASNTWMGALFVVQESNCMSSDDNESHSGTSTKDTDDVHTAVDEGSVHNCDIASNTWMGALFSVQESNCMSSDDNESHSGTRTKDTDDAHTAADEGSVHNCDIASNTWMGALFAVQESHCMSSDDNESHSGISTKDTDDVHIAVDEGSVHNCDIPSNTCMGALFSVQECNCMSSDDNESHSGTSTKDTDDDSNSDGHLTDNDSQSDIDSDEDEIADENSENNTENYDLASEEQFGELGLISFLYSMDTDEDYYPFDHFFPYPFDVPGTTDQDTDRVSNGSISDSTFTSADEDNSGDEKRRSKVKCKRCKPRDFDEKDDEETDDDQEPISYIGSTISSSEDEALDRWNEDGDYTIVINKVSSTDQDSDEGYKEECQGVNESDEDGYKNLKNHDTSCIKYNAIQHISW